MNTATLTAALALLIATRASGIDACADAPTPIPDNSTSGVTIPIEVSAGAGEIVSAVTIDLDITHPWVGDLVITLESPSGTVVTLLDRPGIPNAGFPGPFGCGGRDIDATFSDEASVRADDICAYAPQPVIAGPVRPNQALNAFNTAPAMGTWLVHLSDQSAYDAGQLESACLHITTETACRADLNGDGVLNFFDISAFLSAFTAQDPIADFTGDGQFNFFDVSAFLSAFGAGCP